MKLLEHLVTGQLAVIDVNDGTVTKVGGPAMIRSVSAFPGDKQFRVTTVKKPFSYYVPFTRFGSLEAVWDRGGKSLATLSDRNLRENEPPPATAVAAQPKGRRDLAPAGRERRLHRPTPRRRQPTRPIRRCQVPDRDPTRIRQRRREAVHRSIRTASAT